mgnify:CR=1 FL=1
MFCTNCGASIQDGTNVCPVCGAPVQGAQPQSNQQPQFEQPQFNQPQFNQPYYQQPAVPSSVTPSSVLTWGIVGLAFSCTFFLSFLGIIFSAVGTKKAKKLVEESGQQLSGKAKVGNILAKVGLPLGIVLTIFFIIWVIVIVAAISSAINGFVYY